MTRRYGDLIEVRSGPGDRGEPAGFRSRGRSYVVRTVLARWVEVGPWWAVSASGQVGHGPASPLPVVARTVWRVEAVTARGRAGPTSVHDLVQESAAGHPTRWWLARTLD